jgi:putative membrane protein
MLEQSLIPFGQKFGVKAPTSLDHSDQDEYDRLSKKKGESFDKDYIQTMVDDHQNDAAAFTKEEQTTDNQKLKATVAKGLTVIQHHEEMIDAIAQKNNIPVPAKS